MSSSVYQLNRKAYLYHWKRDEEREARLLSRLLEL
jgi:hypothetical protein